MWTITKILVPTDFTPSSEPAFEAAIDLAKKFGASIVLMHAYQEPALGYPAASMSFMTDVTRQIEQNARKSLEDVATAQRVSGVAITTSLHVGPAWEQILKAAKEHGAELIVIGSKGLRGLPRALMGSTAERVVRYSPVPVLTLHWRLPKSEATAAKEAGAKAADQLVEQWLI